MIIQVEDSDFTRCGFCVEECPTRVIEMPDPDSLPSPTSEAQQRCINCGHCVAVCPHGALSLDTMPYEQRPSVRESCFPEPEHLTHKGCIITSA
jgi:ferredoxin